MGCQFVSQRKAVRNVLDFANLVIRAYLVRLECLGHRQSARPGISLNDVGRLFSPGKRNAELLVFRSHPSQTRAMNMDIATALCKKFEGFKAKPYLCPAGIPTIGYGSTYYADGRKVQLIDIPITESDAADLLLYELQFTYLPGVLRLCPILLTDTKKCNAVTDFAYNLGLGRLQTSTLRRKINAQEWEAAKEQLLLWNKGGGRILPGLDKRRKAECQLFD